MPQLTLLQWALGALCAFSIGMAKTGMPGLGIFVVPTMVLVVGDARQSAGWLLPVLCAADVVAVLYWRRHAAANRLFSLTPWVVIGILGGAVALNWNDSVLRPMVGVIVFVMLAIYLYRRFWPGLEPAEASAIPYGVTAGFATTVANAAGPVMNLYLLSKRLPKEEFIATGAWFFFIINLTKIPIYLWHGLITPASLRFDAFMIPAILTGAVAGRWLVGRIPMRAFEIAVVVLTILSTLMLFR
ncbi:MAG: sulfite exporter TauE/SafE family protein [Acidobacteriia bacterium]|nr:sulfite exporter TauE/SafE family protein [Terriglobia bacterium]